MRLQGIEPRVKETRAAAIRLHREVEYWLGQSPGAPDMTRAARLDLHISLSTFAEVLGILRNVADLIDDHGDLTDEDRARVHGLLSWFRQYHNVAR